MTHHLGQNQIKPRDLNCISPPPNMSLVSFSPSSYLSQTCLLLHIRSSVTAFAASASADTLHKTNRTNKMVRAPPFLNLGFCYNRSIISLQKDTMTTPSTSVFANPDLLERIFLNLPWIDLVNAADVCASWRAVARSPECSKRIQFLLTWLNDERFFDPNYFG